MQLLLISAFMLIVSWIITILGLYFAVKYNEANKVRKSKFFYSAIMLGEIFGGISWYMMIASLVLIIVKIII